ncbi:MAG TPA: SRPBCC domain-containing protein [Ktedonobacterales bacterium]|nr:SRPBCC domain-containing protein [Ktedonobacterales bacterium]
MRVDGTYIFPGTTGRVFATLTNPDALARAIPGCERFIQFGPARATGEVAYEARLRLGQRRQSYVVTLRVTAARQPDYLRLEIRGFGPSGPITGDGTLDLVEQDSHTVAAYRLSLSGPDLPEGNDMAARAANFMARAMCAHLADELYAEVGDEPIWLPGAAPAPEPASRPTQVTAESGKLDAFPAAGAPTWAERAVWMGAGLALGLGAIALTLAIARRLGERDPL